MAYILGFLLSLRDVVLAAYDLVARRLRRRYTYRTIIKAPKETVRSLIGGRDITFARANLRCVEEPLPDAEGAVLTRSFLAGKQLGAIAARKIEDSEDSLSLQYLPEHSENATYLGTDDVFGASFEALPGGSTRLRMYRELTHRRPATRITAPLGLRSLAWLAKTEAEARAGTGPGTLRRWLTQAAWLLAALASFWWLAGWEDAVLLTVLVVLHELGHALALWITGRGVRFITLIPFIGGMAMPKRAYESDAQHAFVALMGPGFSLLPTLGLLWFAYRYNSAAAAHACFMFAFINGINLVPLAVLDGGVVVNTLLHAIHRRLAQAMAWLGTLALLALAFYLRDPLLGVLFVFGGLQLIQQASFGWDLRRKRLRWFQAPVLLVALVLTCCAYAVAIMHAGKLGYALGHLAPPEASGSASAAEGDQEPSHCWMPATSRQALEVYLDAQLGTDNWNAAPRMLAAAEIGGQGDVARRWLAQNAAQSVKTPVSSGTIADFGEALRLARTGAAGDIGAYLTRSSMGDAGGYQTFARLLVLNGRDGEAEAFAAAYPDKVTKWTLIYELLQAGAWEKALAFYDSQALSPEILALTGGMAKTMSEMGRKAEARAFLERLTKRVRQATENGASGRRQAEALYWLVRLGAKDIVLSPQDKATAPYELARAVALRVAQLEDAGDAAGAKALLASLANAGAGDSAGSAKTDAEMSVADMIEEELAAARAIVKLERGGLNAGEAASMPDVDFEEDVPLRAEYLRQGRYGDVEAYDQRLKGKGEGRLKTALALLDPPSFDSAATQRYMDFAYAAAKRGGFEEADRFARHSGRVLCHIHPKARNGGLWRAWFARHIYILKAVEEGRLAPAFLNRF